jgi:cytochrome P450
VHGVPRTTTRPVTLGGVDLPEGADLYVHLTAAQRDPAVFDAARCHRPETRM